MPTYPTGVNGDITGLVKGDGTGTGSFNLKAKRWQLAINRPQHDVSGFGDAGHTYTQDGISSWAGAFVGVMVGSASGGTSITGTHVAYGSVALKADTGKIFTGSCRITNMNYTCLYSGEIAISGQLIGQGPVGESGS